MNQADHRPNARDEQNDIESTGKGKHPSNGLPGKIQAAQSTAPSWATAIHILSVANEAHDRGVPADEVWEEVEP